MTVSYHILSFDDLFRVIGACKGVQMQKLTILGGAHCPRKPSKADSAERLCSQRLHLEGEDLAKQEATPAFSGQRTM